MRHKIIRHLTPALLLSVMATTGCLDEQEASGTDELRRGLLGVNIPVTLPLAERVKYVRFSVNKADGSVVGEEIIPLDPTLALPGGAFQLNSRPVDKDSKHTISSLTTVLAEGKYAVKLEPLDKDKKAAQKCSQSVREAIAIKSQQTTEVHMVIQCEDLSPAGALDVLAIMNNEPKIQRLWWETQDKKPGHKYTCDGKLRLCAQAIDMDNDPLEFTLDARDGACKVTNDGKPLLADAIPGVSVRPQYQCFTIECQVKGGATKLTVNVRDMAWLGGDPVTMETLLKSQGLADPRSRAELVTQGHLLTDKDDRCKPVTVTP